MTICERLFETMDSKGLKAAGLCRFLGINTSITTNWKKRQTDPPAEYIVPICKFLDCSLEYLLTGQETEKTPALEISENGREMLELYGRLSERDQLLLLGRLQEMVSPLLGDGKKTAEDAGAISANEKAV